MKFLTVSFRCYALFVTEALHILSVCLSVRPPSHWCMYCVKTVQAKIMTFSPCAASRFSFLWQNFVPLGAGFSSNEGVEEGYLTRRCYFAVIGLYIVKMVADSYRHAAYHNFRFINLDHLERSWTAKKGFLVNFSEFCDAAHILTPNCNEVAGDRPRQPAYEIFSIKRKF